MARATTSPSRPPATIVHGDYRLGNVMVADDAPARLVAIFDWELSTIGDPLADVGYLTVTWIERDDPEDTMFSSLSAVTRGEGFPTRDELVALYEERIRPLDVGPALVPGARALEGRRVHGGQLQALQGRRQRRRVPRACSTRACPRWPRRPGDRPVAGAADVKGLLVDFGGVLTTNVFDSFRAFCEHEGLDPDAVKDLFREDPEALRELRSASRPARSTEDEFSERFGELLGVERHDGLVDRCSPACGPTTRWSRR